MKLPLHVAGTMHINVGVLWSSQSITGAVIGEDINDCRSVVALNDLLSVFG